MLLVGLYGQHREHGLALERAEVLEADLDELSVLAFDDQCTGANPRYPLVEEIKQLYRYAYKGVTKFDM